MRPIQWSSGSRVNVIHSSPLASRWTTWLAGERQPVLVPEPLVLGIDVGHREVEHDLAAELGAFRHAQVQPDIAAGGHFGRKVSTGAGPGSQGASDCRIAR